MINRLGEHLWASYRSHNLCTSTLQYGELLLSVDKKKRKKLFELKPEGSMNTQNGIVTHESIHGKAPFHVAISHTGAKLTIQRPTLEDYVLLMKRAATPAYPKEIWTMLGLLDVGPGSVVLEAGSGSGSLTLYLSRTGTVSPLCHTPNLGSSWESETAVCTANEHTVTSRFLYT